MERVNIEDFLQSPLPVKEHKLLVNIRGCNGAGKSTIPMSMWADDPRTFEVWREINSKIFTIATVSPKYGFIALGHYHSKTGGMDTIRTTEEIKNIVETFWDTGYHILMEGVLASTVRSTYINLFQSMNELHPQSPREIIIYNLLPPLETCVSRIMHRNGGKQINVNLVENKRNTVERNVEHFRNAGFTTIVADNSNISKDETLNYFFKTLGENNVIEYKHYIKP